MIFHKFCTGFANLRGKKKKKGRRKVHEVKGVWSSDFKNFNSLFGIIFGDNHVFLPG